MTTATDRFRAVALALLMVTSVFAVVDVGAAASGDPSAYAVRQGGQCYDVMALGDGTQSVDSFYDYRNGTGTLFGSYGTQHLQENQVSQLFVYNGSEGVSLVMLHDKLQDGPNGSTVSFNLTGLPESREWVIEDDEYEGRDDNFTHGPTNSTIHWKWAKHRTDGAAVRGLEDTGNYSAIEVDPGFNQDAAYWGIWPYSGDAGNETDAWKLITEPASGNVSEAGDKVTLDMSQNVTVEAGGCEDTTSPNADLQAPDTVEEGEQFTFDASGSTDDEGIVSYEWDFDGDGTTDATTTSATIDHNYSQNGTYDATVTVSDDAGNNDTATKTVTVVEPDEQPPNADLEASPSEAEAGQDVTFDASNSTDNNEIAEYRWDFDGDGNVDDTTQANVTTHAYSATGEYDATVTVVDASGNNDTAMATVNVSDTTPPVARADVPDQVVKNTTFEVDGSASTDNGQIASYEWDFGDGTTATGVNATHSYAQNGTYTVTLTVTDAAGNNNSTTAQVTVTDTDTMAPTAALDAPDSVENGTAVTFDAGDSSDDGEIVEYRWDFQNDGQFDRNTTKSSVSHTYPSTGNYTAKVMVVDSTGKNDTATATVEVVEKTQEPPVAKFDWERTSIDKKIKFDASASNDPDGQIVQYNWSVVSGSGPHQSGKVIRNEYEKFGTYEVTLKIWDDAGNTDTVTKNVTVTDRTAPKVDISAPSKVGVGQQFTAKAVNIQDESNITHLCWIVDGKEVGDDIQKKLTQSFGQTGEHTLKLRIVDEAGNEYTAKHTVKVVANSGGNGGTSPGGGSDDSTDVDVDHSDNKVNVGIDGATGDEPLTIDLPTGTDAGNGLAAFDSITVTLVRSGDYDMTIEAMAEAPEGVTAPTVDSNGFEPLSYLVVEHPDLSRDGIADAEFTFTIPKSRLDALDADASDVQIYRYDDGSWSAVDTSVVEETEDAVQFRASDPGLTTYAVAIDRPVIGLADLSVGATEVAPGESVEITATLANDGQASDVATVELGIDGETVDTRELTVGANSDRSVTFTRTFEEPGTYTVSVNGQEVEVVVQAEESATPTATPTGTPTTPDDGQPGFGMILAVLALLGAALLARRHR